MSDINIDYVYERCAKAPYGSREQFYHDAIAALGLANHPRRDKLFEYAWREGHAAGYAEVFGIMIDLMELIP